MKERRSEWSSAKKKNMYGSGDRSQICIGGFEYGWQGAWKSNSGAGLKPATVMSVMLQAVHGGIASKQSLTRRHLRRPKASLFLSTYIYIPTCENVCTDSGVKKRFENMYSCLYYTLHETGALKWLPNVFSSQVGGCSGHPLVSPHQTYSRRTIRYALLH